MNLLHEEHRRDMRSTTKTNAMKVDANAPTTSASHEQRRDESLSASLRQQLLHRFKLFAIKLKQENMNRENGDFYEQCFNFMGNLIMSNIQGVSKEMFSTVSTSQKLVPVLKTNTPPAVAPITIKREDGNLFMKKFSCNNCDATFPSLRHLERHSVQHTGEKPHICEVS